MNNNDVASLLGAKNNQLSREQANTRASNKTAHAWKNRAEELQVQLNELNGEYNYLSSRFEGLSSRNDRLEDLIFDLNQEGVASNALGIIHTLKAEALNEQAFHEKWTIEQKREANLKLAAEAEYDYRLKNDPSYRLNTCADALMKIANYSDCADAIRKTVGQMYATGKVRKDSMKDELIANRVLEMRAFSLYATPEDVVPTPESIPPMKLEVDENNKEEYESASQVMLNPSQKGASWVR